MKRHPSIRAARLMTLVTLGVLSSAHAAKGDAVTLTGAPTITFDATGTGLQSGQLTLRYAATSSKNGFTPRRVALNLDALPAGVSVTAAVTVTAGRSAGTQVLTLTPRDLVTGIPLGAAQGDVQVQLTFKAASATPAFASTLKATLLTDAGVITTSSARLNFSAFTPVSTTLKDALSLSGQDVTVYRNSYDPVAGYGPSSAPRVSYAAAAPRRLVIRQTGTLPEAVTQASASAYPAAGLSSGLVTVTTAPTVLVRDIPAGTSQTSLELLLDFFMPDAAPNGSVTTYEVVLTDAQGVPVTAPQTITVRFADTSTP